jgi:hypothetical protein
METEKHSISTGTCCGHNRIIGGAGVTVLGCISLKCKLDLYVLDEKKRTRSSIKIRLYINLLTKNINSY